ncbi:MAG TPA: hydrogenase formation protein HypD [Clostridia bacterium]|nr:hydrogenase formation protein HypD [Clostridia bacterium]
MNTIQTITERIANAAAGLPQTTIMEVCGTHTHAIRRHGIRQLLPENIRLVSGPGCPVCVTAEEDIALALALAKLPNVTLFCFGDMMRVPCGDESLLQLLSRGADVRIALSPLDALAFAKEHPAREVVWYGVGFETTTPHTAALLENAKRDNVKNLSVFSAHKTMPNALRALLGEDSGVDALLCPGHVASITGADAFRFLPEELRLPAAISGFEAEELLVAILALVTMQKSGNPALINAYPRVVKPEPNETARALVDAWFTPCDAVWRGLGMIPQSGLSLLPEHSKYDAVKRFALKPVVVPFRNACRCGDVLRGGIEPTECPLFGKVCVPQHPLGACMVSSEGACAAYYQYEGAGI